MTDRQKRAQVVNEVLKNLYPTPPSTPLRYSNPWELLVAVILSAQCTDERVNLVTTELFRKYTLLQDYANADLSKFEQDIKSTGFYKNKAKSVIGAAQKLLHDFGGELPANMKDLVSLPGVGRKTANVMLGEVFGMYEGVVVDTHVIRLCKKFGLSESKNAEVLEKELMELIPKDDWWGFGARLKHYGRDYSPAKLNAIYSDPVSLALIDQKLL